MDKERGWMEEGRVRPRRGGMMEKDMRDKGKQGVRELC